MFSKASKKVIASLERFDYKWIALSNTTLGVLMAAIDSNILLISLPSIFRGIGINPLAPGEVNYLLWTLMSYLMAVAIVLVAFGKISDMFGRVRMYNLGFLIFSIASVLLFFVQGTGNFAALQIIFFRVIQGIGGALLVANSTAILTDAFPANERGLAMGVNSIAWIAGSFIGLLVGGFLAPISWRLVFFISVPFGIIGTIWAYLMLKEKAEVRPNQKLDIFGNVIFALGLTAVLVAITYGILPYGDSNMGWGNPFVIGGLLIGLSLLAVFVWYEGKIEHPLFNFKLFNIREFSAGNLATFLSSLARGGLQFMLIIWLQGIWLPLHGFNFEDTPLWSAIYMLPLTAAFLIFGPLSGYLSDKHGPRLLSTVGMVISAVAFFGFMLLPADFSYLSFAFMLFLMGASIGMFAAPNTASVMSSVPPHERGVASGMRATLQNSATTLSISLIFTLFTIGLAANLPHEMYTGLTNLGMNSTTAATISNIPPTGLLFASFLGYNPLGTLLSQNDLNQLTPQARQTILSNSFFPQLISGAFIDGTRLAFAICAVLSLIAAFASFIAVKKKSQGHHETHNSDMH